RTVVSPLIRSIPEAMTRNRSGAAPATVEVNHSPLAVASPSSFWNTQCKTAPLAAGLIVRPSPSYCVCALAPISDHGMGAADLSASPLAQRKLVASKDAAARNMNSFFIMDSGLLIQASAFRAALLLWRS